MIFEKSGGSDQNLFTLNISTGEFNLSSIPDFESPQEADQNNTYEIWIRAKDEHNSYVEKRLTIQITDLFENSAPSFQSDGNLSVSENTIFVYEFNATDPDGHALTYSIPYGDECHTLFEINATTGALFFISTKDYESPEDNNTDNIYELTIQVSDGQNNSTLNTYVRVLDAHGNPVYDLNSSQISGYLNAQDSNLTAVADVLSRMGELKGIVNGHFEK